MSRHGTLLALLGLAFLARTAGLTAQSLWYDEAVSWLYASGGLGELFRWLPGDNHPPAYFLLLWAWIRLAGPSEYALRFPSVAWGVLLLPLTYVLGRRLTEPRVGLLASLLVALSPLAIWYAQETRMYAQLAGLLVAATYFLVRGWWPAYLLATSAALHTHYFAWLYLPYHGGLAVFQRRLGPWAAAAGVATLLFLPWLPELLRRVGADASYWPGTLAPTTVAWETLRTYALGDGRPARSAWPLALPMAALAAGGLLRLPRGGKRLALMILVPMALLAGLSYQRPKFDPRYLIPSLPAYLLLASAGIVALPGRPGGGATPRPWHVVARRAAHRLAAGAALSLLLASSLVALRSLYTDPRAARPDFRSVAAYLSQHWQPRDVAVVIGGHAYPALLYYQPDLQMVPLPASPVASTRFRLEPSEAVSALNALYDHGYRRLWLVLWQPRLADPLGVVERVLLDHEPRLTVGRYFHGADVLLFGLEHRLPEEPVVGRRLQVVFGQTIELVGYDPPRRVGGALDLRLTWRAVVPVERDLTAFIHLVDGQGRLVSQDDRQLGGDLYPTRLWPVGEVFEERYTLTVPEGLASPRVVVGIYDARTGERLALPDGRDQLALEAYP